MLPGIVKWWSWQTAESYTKTIIRVRTPERMIVFVVHQNICLFSLEPGTHDISKKLSHTMIIIIIIIKYTKSLSKSFTFEGKDIPRHISNLKEGTSSFRKSFCSHQRKKIIQKLCWENAVRERRHWLGQVGRNERCGIDEERETVTRIYSIL